jgi:hypothetical protein
MEPGPRCSSPSGMRLRTLALVPLFGGALGALVCALWVLTRPPCFESEVCRVDLRHGGGCLPGLCDQPSGVPLELAVAISVGLTLGLCFAVMIGVAWSRQQLTA